MSDVSPRSVRVGGESFDVLFEELYVAELRSVARSFVETVEAGGGSGGEVGANMMSTESYHHDWFSCGERPFLWVSVLMCGQVDVSVVGGSYRGESLMGSAGSFMEQLCAMARIQFEEDLAVFVEREFERGQQTLDGA